jgi:hypothetical protein
MNDDRTPALLLSTEESSFNGRTLLTFKLKAVYLNEEGQVRSYLSGRLFSNDNRLADLVVTAQHDGEMADRQPYGWNVEYRDVFSVNADRAAAMSKTLRAIDRKLDKLRDEWGYPTSFEEYVVRVAKALGITTFGWHRNTGPVYDGSDFFWTDVEGIRLQLRTKVADFEKRREEAAR